MSRCAKASLPSRTGVPPVFAARTVSWAEAKSKRGGRLAAQEVVARLASRTKRARVSMVERVSPMRMALEELAKPKKGERFRWR